MRKIRWLGVVLVVAVAFSCFAPLGVAQACGPGPCYWSGAAEVNDVGVEAGTGVSAWINGVMWAETTTGSLPGYEANEFFIGVPAEDPFTAEVEGGGNNGDAVVFKIKRAGDVNWITALINGQESAIFNYEGWYTNVLLTAGGVEATLEGQVHLEGRSPAPNATWVTPLMVTFLQGGTEVRTLNITTNDTGAFNITGIAPGTYDIRVKNSHTLSNLKSGVVFAAGEATAVDFGTLIEGDATNDNVVDIDDVSLVASCFGKLKGEPGFIDNCDFNRDGVVDIDDITLIIGNFGLAGDIIV